MLQRTREMGFPIPRFVVFFLLCISCGAAASLPHNQALALGAFKGAIFDDPYSVWASPDAQPCSWTGINCSQPKGLVISIKLANLSLKGFLAPDLGLLTSLQELVLCNNLFLGPIPKQIGQLKRLKMLDLSGNQLSGSIPHEIGGLSSIMTMNLNSNKLSGAIPYEIGNLSSLSELLLDSNNLTGALPGGINTWLSTIENEKLASQNNNSGFCHLHHLKVANFSFNFFVGKIPTCLKLIPRSSFEGNCFEDEGTPFRRASQQCRSVRRQEVSNLTYVLDESLRNHVSHQPKWLLSLEITTGAIAGIFLVICVGSALKSHRLKRPSINSWRKPVNWGDKTSIQIDIESLKTVLKLTRQQLEGACEDFSNIIGSSSDSTVYKGIMENGVEIAVISLCISENQWTSSLEVFFQNEVKDFARLNHENTAKLLGYCQEAEPFSRMLVFEYASNGTLYEHIHYGDGCQLSWLKRMRIAKGVARGLRYLHTELLPPFTISELNSNSVYLTEDFSPKLVDIERWRTIFSNSESSGCLIADPCRTPLGHLERRHIDIQGNTFAFGVLLLELISGRPSFCKDKGCLIDWAMEHLQHPEKMAEIIDSELKDVNPDDLSVVCGVVSLCIDAEQSRRPSMQIICALLEDGIDTSAAAHLKSSSLSWAQIALS